ncbi:hypothetical protein [Streptomyces sp. S.PNR 29]|uniref:hypothetical protein n=1 Tax=Streptomyces sp. S.PNR 29 TaxID=2973805 RepID=UPI0025B1DC5A|nr:hypothetical protein [Streptomyces sp. S.PNR 29]MDN0195384.1 hypothetical protein [Streptomyces sp. S.PNR 29]
MNRSSGARIGATTVVGALSLALITGCGGESDEAKGSDGSSSPTQAAKVLGAAELKKLIIAQGDVDGYTVKAVPSTYPASKSAIKGDEQCKPLVYVFSGLAPGDAVAETNTMASEEKKPTDAASKSLGDLSEDEIEDALNESMSAAVTVVSLSSYEGDGAEKTMKTVSDAIEGCSGGFTAGSGDDEQKFTKVTAEKAQGTGDESVAFAASGEMEGTGGQSAVHAQVVRHGNTVATYYTMNLGAMMTGKDYTVPAPVIDAQAAKLK